MQEDAPKTGQDSLAFVALSDFTQQHKGTTKDAMSWDYVLLHYYYVLLQRKQVQQKQAKTVFYLLANVS